MTLSSDLWVSVYKMGQMQEKHRISMRNPVFLRLRSPTAVGIRLTYILNHICRCQMCENEKSSSPIGELLCWLRRLDLNQRPSGYEPDELPLLHSAISCLELDYYTILYLGSQAFIQKLWEKFYLHLKMHIIRRFWLFFCNRAKRRVRCGENYAEGVFAREKLMVFLRKTEVKEAKIGGKWKKKALCLSLI